MSFYKWPFFGWIFRDFGDGWKICQPIPILVNKSEKLLIISNYISGQGGVRRFPKWVKTGPRGQEGGKEEVSRRGCPAADTSTGGDLFHAPETGMKF